jgi:hypothetical protein
VRVLAGVTFVLTLLVIAVALPDPREVFDHTPAPSTPAASDSGDSGRRSAWSAPQPGIVDVRLPAEFEPRESLVSPDGRYVAAAARDRGNVRMYRLGTVLPGTVSLQLQQIAEVRGFVQGGDVSWLEDSSALLVRSDLVPGHTLQNRDPDPAFRIVILNTDGTVVTAPADVTSSLLMSYPQRRTPLSPDRRWLPILDNRFAPPRVRLLSRSGLELKTIVAAPTDDSLVSFFGWDSDGDLLYQQSWPDRSALITLEANGSVRSRVPAPAEFRGAAWGTIVTAPDRSWRVIQFAFGVGSDFREYRLLVGAELRALPPEVEQAARHAGVFARGSEIVYRTSTGAMRGYDVRTRAMRTLGLVVAPNAPAGGVTTIGIIDRYFVWMEMLKGFVGDLESGAIVELALPSPPASDRLDGTLLALYRSDGIVIADLAAMLR